MFYNSKKSNLTSYSKNGLTLRAEPSLSADKITSLPFLTSVSLSKKTNKYDTIVDEGREIVGYWVNVMVPNSTHQGYMFSPFLQLQEFELITPNKMDLFKSYSLNYNQSSILYEYLRRNYDTTNSKTNTQRYNWGDEDICSFT